MTSRFSHRIALIACALVVSLCGQAFILPRQSTDLLDDNFLDVNDISPNKALHTRQLDEEENREEEEVEYFHWVLAWWKNNDIACNIFLTVTGEPSLTDIENTCGSDVLRAWTNTPICNYKIKTKCAGLYLAFYGLASQEDVAALQEQPKFSTRVSLYNCDAWGTCEEKPQMLFSVEGNFIPSAQAPLVIQIGNQASNCEASNCLVEMPNTGENGLGVAYWVKTMEGEVLFEKRFRMRSIPLEDRNHDYLFQLLGEEWEGQVDCCANSWDHFPDLETDQSAWMMRGDDPALLYTAENYVLLAGKLIWHGYVDASVCENSGLLPNGAADACGLEQARDMVVEWQNRLDPVIIKAANETFIPPRLIKGLIAQESQFWPLWPEKREFGYGMLTENGIDLLLNWNTEYYLKICNKYYTPDVCGAGYSALDTNQRRFLRGACLLAVGTDEEITLLANILKAACNQTAKIVKNITGEEARSVFSYENLWRVSLGVYHSGVGCMSDAIDYAWSDYGEAMSWEQFKKHIQKECEAARDYFDKVIDLGE